MTQQISSITRGPRQSNFELLRIIAMFMVLTVHADFIALGKPTAESIAESPAYELTRIFFEAIAVCGVNIFVLISGWFGIRSSIRGFLNFWFQVVFFYGLSFAVMAALGIIPFSIGNIILIFCLKGNGWFVISYSILYILSPVLNAFKEKADNRTMINVVIAFFSFEAVYSVIANVPDFAHGYSALSFIGLYLLAELLKRFSTKYYAKWGLWVFCGFIIFNFAVISISKIFSVPIGGFAIYYSSPFVIIPSAGLLMYFSEVKLKPNRFINWVAASAFAVYLFHDNVFTFDTLYQPLIRYANRGGLATVLLSIICVYVMAVILDQPRKYLWKKLNEFSR